MSSRSAGEKIFRERTEYPLPRKAGTRDYVFFCLPTGDTFGKEARKFFDRFYKDHEPRNASSLEGMIAQLAADLARERINAIREIAIVAHGCPQALLFPVVDGATRTHFAKYKEISAASLVALQQEIESEFPTLFQQRKNVIARLSPESWITLRACNFGQSRAGIFALYSFFGGHANLYSPRLVQLFGRSPLTEGMRLESTLDVFEHLVKQRLLPTDAYTVARKNKIVQFVSDPARFSAPRALLTVDLNSPAAPATRQYQEIIRRLNAGRMTDILLERLRENDIVLTRSREVSVVTSDARWAIRDKWVITDPSSDEKETFDIEYLLSESLSPPQATLEVEATLVGKVSAKAAFPIQLFLENRENREFHGLIFPLAGYTEDTDPSHQARYEAILSLLQRRAFGDDGSSPVNLVQAFDAEGIPLTQSRTLTPLSAETWLLRDQTEYLIKVEHPPSSTGSPAHTISVYGHYGKAARLRREVELMARLGVDPDQPGTELLSFLDRLSFDDLANLIDYLRNPYRPAHALYLHHAIQALNRKHGFEEWLEGRADAPEPDPLFPHSHPYGSLSLLEQEDKNHAVYDFESNVYWAEVKASNPPPQPFRSDLFTEQALVFDPAELFVPDNLEPDSPASDLDGLQALESVNAEPFFSREKWVFTTPTDELDDISCEKFGQLIALVKTFAAKSEPEIEEALRNFKIAGDRSLFNFYGLPKPLKFALDFWKISAVDPGIVERALAALLVGQPVLGVTYHLRPIALYIYRGLGYVGIAMAVAEIFLNYLNDYSNTLAYWEQAGKLAGIRQWLRALLRLSSRNENAFPTEIAIDIGNSGVAAYIKELNDEHGDQGERTVLVFSPDRIQQGFEDGVRLIEAEANEVLSKSELIIDRALRMGGLDACKIQKLRDANVVDPARTRALVMREFARFLLTELPKIHEAAPGETRR